MGQGYPLLIAYLLYYGFQTYILEQTTATNFLSICVKLKIAKMVKCTTDVELFKATFVTMP